MKKYLALCVFLLSACATRQKIMDVPAVSMTHSNLPEGAQTQDIGTVSGTYCASSSMKEDGMGLFDEAIRATQNANNVDFITSASFYVQGGCTILEGTGQRITNDNHAPKAH